MRKTVETAAAEKPMHKGLTSPVLVVAAFVVLVGASFASVDVEGSAQDGSTGLEALGPQVTGFRSAQFGMSKSETLKAIQNDFQLQQDSIEEQWNDEDRTSSLVTTVTDIFPDSDPAQVVYIHGHKQKKLFQVNILWGSPVTEEPDPQALVTTANILRKYFVQLGFDPETTVMNTRVDDGSFIVFRATDQRERMVLLQLISRKVPDEKGEGEETPELRDQVVSLWLSYIENTVNPDIFQIEEGKF